VLAVRTELRKDTEAAGGVGWYVLHAGAKRLGGIGNAPDLACSP
jgi:hypothetical protein